MARPAPRATTSCSSIFLFVTLLLGGGAAQAEVVTEARLVKAFRSAAPQKAAAAAARRVREAAAQTEPYLRHPDLVLRREQSLSSATEFSTTVAGLGVTLEIGGRHGLRRRAARLEAEALASGWRARQGDSECSLRVLATQANAAQQEEAILAANRRHLQGLVKDLSRLVDAGERAAFDLSRLKLQLQNHGARLAAQRARLAAALARLGALTGLQVTGVALDPLPRSQAGVPHAVQALRARARAQQERIAALSRRWVPDLGLYGAYRADTAPGADVGHGYEIGLTLNLPLTDTGRARRQRAAARRHELLARAHQEQARRRALLAGLAARTAALSRSLSQAGVDREKLGRDATRRYLKGVSPLSGLLDTLRGLEQAALHRARSRAALRAAALRAACARGDYSQRTGRAAPQTTR